MERKKEKEKRKGREKRVFTGAGKSVGKENEKGHPWEEEREKVKEVKMEGKHLKARDEETARRCVAQSRSQAAMEGDWKLKGGDMCWIGVH